MSFGPENTPFNALGGEPVVRRMVDAFYDHMDSDPPFEHLRALHPESLVESRDKLHDFLCGWLGGPQHYMNKHGHPRLKMRHAPFPIGEIERDQWLACMALALDDLAVEGEIRSFLDGRFAHVADFMRNQG
ncbi:MAG: group II truncated hemoglobin [Phycisphaera sp.]|nr:group II truncated hemoglobin [Phycisphaera sp.]